MDFRFLFFDPQGRIGPRAFGQGFIVLTGVMLVIMTLSVVASPQVNMLQYALVFPYVCLFGKRLHDAGMTAWLWLAFVVGWGILNAVVGGILMQMMVPGASDISMEVFNAIMAPDSVDQAELSAKMEEFVRLSAVPNILGFLISAGLTGFAAYSLRSDPNSNRYGLPTSGGGRPDTRS